MNKPYNGKPMERKASRTRIHSTVPINPQLATIKIMKHKKLHSMPVKEKPNSHYLI
jgi:hypothetical protein